MNEKIQSTGVRTGINQMLELSGKDFKTIILKVTEQAIANYLKQMKKIEHSKETEVIKKNQMEIIELKNKITE